MRRLLRVAVFVAILAAVGCGYWYWQVDSAQTDNQHLVLYGNVDIRQAELAIDGSDRIAQLLVEEGDRVKSGQLLAKLDTERLELAVQQAEAQVETQTQVVARLQAGSRPEEIRKARADVEAAAAAVHDAELVYRRSARLREKNAVAQQDVDNAKAAFDSAQARQRALQAQLDLVLAGPRKEDIAEARAVLKRFEVQRAQAQHALKDGSLHAPCAGVVQDRILEVGDMASPQKPVFTLALTDPVWVRAYVSESDLGKIHEGMPATVATDSFPDKQYEGWVGFISPTAEFTPKPVETAELRTKLVYQVRVFVKNPNNELRLGMPATVTIRVGQGTEGTGTEPPADEPRPSAPVTAGGNETRGSDRN